MEKKSIVAILLVVSIFLGIFFAYSFIIENAHHDCNGEDCPICLEIKQAIQFISNVKFVPILSYIMTVLSVFTLIGVFMEKSNCKINTLITLKVELLI